VRVRAFGINRADLLQRCGLYPAPPDAPANIPGLEYAGIVEAVDGAGAPRTKTADGSAAAVGDRVMGIVPGGAYAEEIVVPAALLLPVPEGLGFEEAAAIPEAFITAWDALQRLELCAGEWVLVMAVGSGVGTAAVQLVRARGARSIGASRTAAKLQRAADLGMDAGVDLAHEPLAGKVQRITREGAHAAIDLVGGALLGETLQALRPRGRLVLVGLTGGRTAQLDLALLLSRRLRIEGTVLRSRSPAEKLELMAAFAQAVLPLLRARSVRPVVDRVLPFEQIRDAHRLLEANATFGKLVVRVS
jgi:NADPH:quinone reductase-like Zn-dependent oxidoreductase